jgi:hypothetical protein
MTTTVRVLIEGNKECEVTVQDMVGAPPRDPVKVMPGSFTVKTIHGEQSVLVKEIGGFVS